MTDSVAEGLARERAHRQLLTQLARHLFGWEWRQDWQAWCPPGWPPIEVSNPPYATWATPLEQHGGVPPGHTAGGSRDERGRPIIPEYVYHADATELIWQWLHAQPGIQSVRFIPLPIPPDSLRGIRPWRCEIVIQPGSVVTGEGQTHGEALCYAVLALATTHAAAVG